MRNWISLGVLIVLGTALTACGDDTVSGKSDAGAANNEEKIVNVYNWSDYIAADTLENFQKETGIKVRYDVYDSMSMLEAKLLAGGSGYDVVFPSLTPFLAQQIKAGIYQPLDWSKLTNSAGLSPTILKTMSKNDPENTYSVPYMVAPTGIGINVAKVKERLGAVPQGSGDLLFSPEVTAKLEDCGISLLDDPVDVIPAVLAWMGKDPISQDPADLAAAMEVLKEIRPNLKYIHSSSYINDLANGDLCVAQGYGGDLIQARDRAKEADNGVEIMALLPREGTAFVIDTMAIPKDAPHPGNAHIFINYMMRPGVVAAITNTTGYANAVPASLENVDDAIKSDPFIYPSDEERAKGFSVPPADKDYERERTRAWSTLKTEIN
ncbi:polyamine ABC transporter substrate-binding protein [Emcibacter sp. SYSU 3D8]|uniref:polyamine ABC transporter substrate-binding protein n=1 Tax=Emcibacter sp. SYSU 3D8 TaxID=3133969 RepID=UPI0031FE5B59